MSEASDTRSCNVIDMVHLKRKLDQGTTSPSNSLTTQAEREAMNVRQLVVCLWRVSTGREYAFALQSLLCLIVKRSDLVRHLGDQ